MNIQEFREIYIEKVVANENSLKRASYILMGATIPSMILTGATTEIAPPVVGMAVSGLGVIALSLSLAAHEINQNNSGQQG